MATTTRIDKYLGSVRSQKNSLLPIFRLPPETLESIFTNAARDCYEATNRSSFHVPDWVNVSYVCRHWRNVALNCPTLWAYHFTVSPRWTEELLARSRHASLKIRIHYEHGKTVSWWSHLVEKVLNHDAGRIHELHLIVPGDALPTALSLNFSRLQILVIYILEFYSPARPPQWTNHGVTLPLRTLRLFGCPLLWYSSFNLSGVTTLFLCSVPSPSQQNILEFLTTLSRMQALTVLHLENALPSACEFLSSAAFGVSPKVTLPCLARLFVHGPLSTVVGLLSCVDLPLKTQVRLEIESEDNSSMNDFVQLPSVLAQRFSRSEDLSSSIPAIRSLFIRFAYNSEFALRLECGDWDPSVSYPPHDCNIPLAISFRMDDLIAFGHGSRIVADICCSIPLAHVQTLYVFNPPFKFSDDFWRKTLGRLDGLRYLKLSHGCMPSLARSLLSLTDGPVEAPRQTFVPGLEALNLYRITFSSGRSEEFVSAQRSLVDALSTRKMLHLTMTECDVKDDEEDDRSDCECHLCLLVGGNAD